MSNTRKTITILSGGMDSATMAFLLDQDQEQTFLSFQYGQKHSKEIESARKVVEALWKNKERPRPFYIIDISDFALLSPSALTTPTRDIPEGHYAENNMAQTVVPNRNALFLSLAWASACFHKADSIAYGAHAGDHVIYPDCRIEFYEALTQALRLGTEGTHQPGLSINAPFIQMTKAEIVSKGLSLGVPFELTWTCYKGGDISCGRCGSCVERLQAFAENGVEDPLEYQDRKFWEKAVTDFKGKAVYKDERQ